MVAINIIMIKTPTLLSILDLGAIKIIIISFIGRRQLPDAKYRRGQGWCMQLAGRNGGRGWMRLYHTILE